MNVPAATVKNIWVAATLAIVSAASTPLWAEDGGDASPHKVDKTYNNSPFEYQMRPVRKTEAFTVYRLTYPSPVVTAHAANNTIPGDYFLPTGIEPGGKPRPAVICLHILNGNFELENMLCSALATRGIPAIMFKLPYYGERELPEGRGALLKNPRLFLSTLEQGAADVRRTVDLLAARPEVDPGKIGVAGISLGGLLGASTAAEESRLSRAALILAGGDLMAVIKAADEAHELRECLEKLPPDQRTELEAIVHAADPLSHAAGLRGRAEQGRVLMINGTDDRVMPRQCAEKLAAALGMSDRVVWLDGLGHYTAMAALPRIMQTTVDFFAADLPEGVKPAESKSPAAGGDPKRTVIALLQEASTLLNKEPERGRCHFADVEITVPLKDNKSAAARLRFVRGWEGRFRLGLKINHPINVELEFGQDDYPWMASAGKAVFLGKKATPAEDGSAKGGVARSPLAFAEQKHLLKLQMAAGLVAGVSFSPDLLDNLAAFEEKVGDDGRRELRISRKGEKKRESIAIFVQKDATTPDEIRLSIKGVEATLKFHVWQMNTVGHEALFHPPGDLPEQEVERDDIYRVFSSLFNFAMEMAQ